MPAPVRSRLAAVAAALLVLLVAAAPAAATQRATSRPSAVTAEERGPGTQIPSRRGESHARRMLDPRAVAAPLPERSGAGRQLNPWTMNPKLGDKAPASDNPESPSSSSGPSTPVTDATIPTTTTLIAPQTVTYPEQVHLEAVVSPAPQPDQGATPAISFTLNGQFWRPAPIDPTTGHAFVIETLPIGTYQFGAQFGPWGDLEASASAPATVHVVEVPGLASSLPSTRVQSSHGFAGLAATTTSSSPGPEPGIAVGPGHIVQATTAGFRFSNRSGQPMFDVPLPDFFLEDYATSSDARQPRILYDDLHDRWLAVEVARGSVGHLNIAISTTSDPTDVWWVYDFTFAPGRFPDNPSIGVSSNKIAIGLDEWTSAPGFLGSSLLVISSASILDGDETITYDTTDPNPNQVSWRPAVGQSTGNTLHAVASTPGFGSGHLLHMTVTGTVAGGLTFTVEDLTAGLLTLPGPGEAVLAQAATSETGDAVGWYLPLGPIAAVWQGGSLWFVSDRSCLPEGASSAQACVRVTELSTGTTTGLVQDFVVNSEERSTFDPGLGVTGAGDLILTFTRSGPFTGMLPASPVTILAAVQKASDPPNSLHVPAVIDRASSFSAPSYWSSATGVARDPLDPAAIWQGGAVTKAGGWRTWISRLAAATAGPGGSLVLNGGRGHANALRILAGGSLAAADGATRMRLSGSSATTNGKLTKAAEFPIGDEIAWSLANPATGGTTATGLRHVYVQWGDGAGGWSAVEDATVTVDTPLGASFVPLNPARLLDTRTGIGLSGKFAALAPRSFQVTGRGGVPAGAVAVTGNLTVTGPSRSGYVFLGPTATSSPTSSTLNFPLGETRANGVTVKLSGTGKLGAVYVAPAGASTHLIFDVTGYFVVADPNTPTGTTWRPIEPLRVLDTRVGTGLLGRIHNSSPVVFFVTGFGIPRDRDRGHRKRHGHRPDIGRLCLCRPIGVGQSHVVDDQRPAEGHPRQQRHGSTGSGRHAGRRLERRSRFVDPPALRRHRLLRCRAGRGDLHPAATGTAARLTIWHGARRAVRQRRATHAYGRRSGRHPRRGHDRTHRQPHGHAELGRGLRLRRADARRPSHILDHQLPPGRQPCQRPRCGHRKRNVRQRGLHKDVVERGVGGHGSAPGRHRLLPLTLCRRARPVCRNRSAILGRCRLRSSALPARARRPSSTR